MYTALQYSLCCNRSIHTGVTACHDVGHFEVMYTIHTVSPGRNAIGNEMCVGVEVFAGFCTAVGMDSIHGEFAGVVVGELGIVASQHHVEGMVGDIGIIKADKISYSGCDDGTVQEVTGRSIPLCCYALFKGREPACAAFIGAPCAPLQTQERIGTDTGNVGFVYIISPNNESSFEEESSLGLLLHPTKQPSIKIAKKAP